MSMQTVRPGKTPGTAGRRTVMYRATTGKTYEALVIGPGSGSGLKLRLVNLRVSEASRIRDNVLPATAMRGAGSTDRYFRAWSPNQTLA